MSNIGQIICKLRKEKNITQEELGKIVGVSTQAVSKWENGGMPDAPLLPIIADTLGVSIDSLFGREASSINIDKSISNYIASIPESERIKVALRLCWALSRGLSGNKDLIDGDNLDLLLSFEKSSESEVTLGNDICLMKIYKGLPYFFLMPEPECGYRSELIDYEKHKKLFLALSEKDVYGALIYLHSRDKNPFTIKYLSKQLNLDIERTSNILNLLCEFKFVTTKTLQLDDEDVRIFTSYENPALLPFLAFANRIIDRPEFFTYKWDLQHNSKKGAFL